MNHQDLCSQDYDRIFKSITGTYWMIGNLGPEEITDMDMIRKCEEVEEESSVK